MRSFVVIVYLMISWAKAQNGRGPQQDHNGHGWDIRLAVPGQPGNDYPTLGAIPRTGFSCAGKEPGYYADLETNCQVFRVCTVGSTYGFQSFLCPNGTLFNQEVFVCDWWMNVKCQNSEPLFTNNNEQFGNLRLGPQLMKDIKKMLTHPMRNPYDRNIMKNSRIVMQEYKPPSGQLFPNGALLAGPERQPSNVYVPSKQTQQNIEPQQTYSNQYNTNPSTTPDSRYIPAAFSTNRPPQRDVEIFLRQQQRQSGQYQNKVPTQNVQSGNVISNGHAAQYTQIKNSAPVSNAGHIQSPRPTQNYKLDNIQPFRQNQNIKDAQTNSRNSINVQRGERGGQQVQKLGDTKPSQLNNFKQAEFSNSFTKQQYNTNDVQQPYTIQTPFPQHAYEATGNEFKQNLVSTTLQEAPSTIVTKSLTYSRIIQDPKPNKPKSRITVKTWIVKPSAKGAKLIAEPTSYIYNRPTQATAQKLFDDPTPYTYNRPTATIQLENEESDSEEPYIYNRPSSTTTQFPKLIDSTTPYIYNKPTATIPKEKIVSEPDEPYIYNRPTEAAKQVITTTSQSSRYYLPPTPVPRPSPTFSERLTDKPTSILPTKPSRLYLPPTTFKPASKLYVPPSDNTIVLSRQYLSPDFNQRPAYYQSSQLRATPTTPSFIPTSGYYKPELTVVKQSHVNANHKNLTFADILTKEKLDITVNNIVKDTDTILQTASPEPFSQYKQDLNYVDYPEENSLPTQPEKDSGENLTSQTPAVATKSSRVIAQPATHLEAPVETYLNPSSNRLSNLPYLKEPNNIIERTVSLKISIPEKIAALLFKNQNDTDFDSLEILNAGSSNYLVLTNPLLNKSSKANFIPLGKLVGNKNNKLSNSQALVYSFLADSINVAKEYSTLAQQDITSPSFQNLNSEELARITNNVSQLTSSQYSGTNYDNNAANRVTTTQPSTTQTNNQYRIQQNPILPAQYITAPSQQTQKQTVASQLQSNGVSSNILGNTQNQIYSGQLYQVSVPEVTAQIYNRPNSANLVQANNLQSNIQAQNVQNSLGINSSKQSNSDVEIVRSQTIPIGSAMLHVEPNEPELLNSQEALTNLLYSNNGISAQLQDKIVGSIPHPLEENKRLTYKKDRNYYLFSKFDEEDSENFVTNNNIQQNNVGQQNTKDIRNYVSNDLSFQLIPSVSYQLDGQKEQNNFLNSFRIDEFGAPRELVNGHTTGQGDRVLTSSIDYSVEHPTAAKLVDSQNNSGNTIYNGPSSYSAPQASVGNLQSKQINQSNFKSKLEQFNENQSNGYNNARPATRFSF